MTHVSASFAPATVNVSAQNPDLMAMMAYLRDAAPDRIGLYVPDRADIKGTQLQAGLRLLFERATMAAKAIETVAAEIAPAPVAKRGKAAPKAKVAEIGTIGVFLAVLKRVMRASATRSTVPIFGCVRLTIRSGLATLQCTDTERAIAETVTLPDVADVDVCVSAKILYNALRAAPAWQLLPMTTSPALPNDPGNLLLLGMCIPTLPVEDFPNMAGIGVGVFPHSFEIDSATLRNMLQRVSYAISTEETRYYLNGVYLELDSTTEPGGHVLRMVTTDGHRLSTTYTAAPAGCTAPDAKGSLLPSIIIPSCTIADILALTDKVTGPVTVDVSDTRLRLTVGATVLLSKLVDGTFPEYRRVMPSQNCHDITVGRDALADAVKAVKVVHGTDRCAVIRFTISDGTLQLSASNPERGVSSKDVAVISGGGFNLEIGFSARYVLDSLAAVQGDVMFSFGETHRREKDAAPVVIVDPGAPCMIRDTADFSAEMVLMPMRI